MTTPLLPRPRARQPEQGREAALLPSRLVSLPKRPAPRSPKHSEAVEQSTPHGIAGNDRCAVSDRVKQRGALLVTLAPGSCLKVPSALTCIVGHAAISVTFQQTKA